MAGWRFYARRAVSGLWLDTDVPLEAEEITEELSRPGVVRGTIPAGLDRHLADDGKPLWLERGTLLYAELAGDLEWCGFCSYQGAEPDGRRLEFTSLFGAFQRIPYDGVYAAWNPRVVDVVDELVEKAQRNPRADLGFNVALVGEDPGIIGDEEPPKRPKKPGRRKRESLEHYDDRLLSWEMAVDEWERKYAAREKYRVAWWEATMVGHEIDTLASEVPFDYREVHRWTDPDALEASHTFEVSKKLGRRRLDISFIDGMNLAERLTPETDMEGYANDLIVLGAGEGRGMKRGRASVDDDRLWTAKVVQAKHLKGERRLRLRATREAHKALVGTKLEEAHVWDAGGFAPVTTLQPGDEVWVESAYTTPAYGDWRRIVTITRSSSDTARATLRFG